MQLKIQSKCINATFKYHFMQLLCSAKICLDHFMDNNSQSFIHIKYSEKNLVCFHLHLFIYENFIHFVEF